MDFLQDAINEPEDDLIDSTGCASVIPPGTDTITLDITYDDPELRALFSVASSKWANEGLTDSLKQGRVANDLWALGLPTPDAVTSVSITDNQYLCVKTVVTCDDLVDLSSILDPANKYRQQLRIKSISILEKYPRSLARSQVDKTSRKNAANALDQKSFHDDLCTLSSNDDTVGDCPITTVSDYYRRYHLGTVIPVQSTVPPLTPRTLQEPLQTHSEPELTSAADTSRGRTLAELEKKLFAAELELGLQSRRLRDTHRELQQRQAQVDGLASQLKDQELELASAQKVQLGDAERETSGRNGDHVPEQQADSDEDPVHRDVAVIGAPGTGAWVVDLSEPLSCVRCEVRCQSAKLSELHLRTMELRVTMSERRQTEIESHAVQLLHALQLERRTRLQTEAELVAERQKRRDAEEVAEAIANEAKWPFVMPDMLDMFLKLEGIVEEVSREGKEG